MPMPQCPNCFKFLDYEKDIKICSACNKDIPEELIEQLRTEQEREKEIKAKQYSQSHQATIRETNQRYRDTCGWLIAFAVIPLAIGLYWLFKPDLGSRSSRDIADLITVLQGAGLIGIAVFILITASTFAALSNKK